MQPDAPVNILLVDDRPENLLTLEAVLEPLGHNLVKAHSGQQALKQLLRQDFAVVLLDVQMPDFDGFETAELIRRRERSQHTPIIFLTAVNTSDLHVFRGYAVGAVDYMLKPIVPTILLSKVAVFIELYKKARRIERQADELAATVAELQREVARRERSEAQLLRAQNELEQRVRERTAGLSAANQALRVEIAEREKAVRARDQFLSIASHELKTPLTSLYGNLQLIQRRLGHAGSLEQRNQRLLDVSVEQAARLNTLIAAMLDISRIQGGQLTITRSPLDLGRLVGRVIGEVQPVLEEHALVFQPANEPLPIEGDELRLEQVLQNLLQNAIKYSPVGGTISVAAGQHNGSARVTITDQGVGIAPEELPHIFQRFYRVDNDDTRNVTGMGIGLYVVKEIVALHSGAVEVASAPGAGSTFTCSFPLHAP